MRLPVLIPLSLIAALLAACGSPGPRPPASTETIAQASRPVSEKGNEIVLYAMGLLDTGYRFGGKNPEAGLDCSGMVSYIYGQAAGLGSRAAPPTSRATAGPSPRRTAPGDLVFFNTLNRSFSHVGIYIGDRVSSTPHRPMAACASTA
jgi:cell wall-associated NlpC family hydrolase